MTIYRSKQSYARGVNYHEYRDNCSAYWCRRFVGGMDDVACTMWRAGCGVHDVACTMWRGRCGADDIAWTIWRERCCVDDVARTMLRRRCGGAACSRPICSDLGSRTSYSARLMHCLIGTPHVLGTRSKSRHRSRRMVGSITMRAYPLRVSRVL